MFFKNPDIFLLPRHILHKFLSYLFIYFLEVVFTYWVQAGLEHIV